MSEQDENSVFTFEKLSYSFHTGPPGSFPNRALEATQSDGTYTRSLIRYCV